MVAEAVCGEGWTERDAGLVCSRLGYSREGGEGIVMMNLILYIPIESCTHSDPGTDYGFGEGTGPIHTLTCQQTDCEQVILTSTTSCSHSQDVGVRCESYNEACTTDSRDEITPRECPTHCNIGSTKETITTPTEATEANRGITNAFNSSTIDSLLGALLGLLGVILAVVLTGWIVTCVYLQRKINKYKLF